MPSGRNTRHDLEPVLEAVRKHKGVAKAVAVELGVCRHTVRNYKEKWPEVREAFEDERENRIDVAESKLHELIDQGNLKAIIFFLRTQGRDRGYGDPQKNTAPEPEPTTPVYSPDLDISSLGLTLEQKKKLLLILRESRIQQMESDYRVPSPPLQPRF